MELYRLNCCSESRLRNKPHENETNCSTTKTAELRTAGFVLESGTMLNSPSPISHSCTLCAPSNQKCNHVTAKALLWPLCVPCRPTVIILPQRIGSHNYINLRSLPESDTHPRGSLGRAEGKLSAVPSRRVMAGWPNCLFLLS